jgi:alpha-mannosidase/mannosylglycerate hydrolase
MSKSSRPAQRSATRSSLIGHYIASTHWDREWYEPFQQYRFRLVDVFDGLIDIMERDPEYRSYQLDGQTIILEDYLAIRPEQRARLQALFDAGRIDAGPWYVMPDEFIVCGESLVRNLQMGHEVAERFGRPLKVGFVCDIFGHNSQMPQIFRGFGMADAVVWRGVNTPETPGLFHWRSPDGSSVLSYCFEDRGYGNYWFDVRHHDYARPFDLEKGVAGLRKLFDIEHAHTPGNAIILFDGLDHIWPEPAATEFRARAARAGMKVVHSSWPEYFAAVRAQRLKLPSLTGELRETGIRCGQCVIPGVDSSRIVLKQENAACENRLLHWVEPFSAAATLVGHEYPAMFVRLAWRYLLQNHPHDSICGCSIDQVHRDMLYRFDQCRQIAERAGQMGLRALADRTALPKLKGAEDFAVTVFNPNTDARDEIVDLPLYFPPETENRYHELGANEPLAAFRLYDEHDREVPYQRLDVTKLVPTKNYDRLTGYKGGKYERVRVAAKLNVPPCGWTTLVCKPVKEHTRCAGSQLVDDHTLENEHLRVRVNPNGTLDITQRAAGHTYGNALTFEESADIGDGWYHGEPANDEVFTSHGAHADIAVVHDGFALTTLRVRVTMNVPARFLHDKQIFRRDAEAVPLVITNWVTLRAGARHIEVRTEVENTIRDHRLRVLVPTGLRGAETYFADSPYDVIERRIGLAPDALKHFELELETKPQYSFTAVSDGERGMAVISTGQPESAVRNLPERPIALTLFRGFARTVGQEGEPDGQMLGRTVHRYWLYPHVGGLPVADILRLGQKLAAGVECLQTTPERQKVLRRKSVLPATGSWLTPGPGPLVLTACKQAEDGQGLVMRLFNPTTEECTQELTFCAPLEAAFRTDMLEQPVEALHTQGATLTLHASPKQIVTLRVRLQSLDRPAAARKPAQTGVAAKQRRGRRR